MISYGLPSEGLKRGGIERVAHELADGLAARGHAVTVWSYDPPPAGARYAWRLLPGQRLALHWFGRRLMMGYLGNLITALPRYRDADIVITHGDSLLLPLLRKPLLRIMHGSALEEARHARSPLRKITQTGVYLQELLSAAMQSGVVGVSENTRQYNPFVRRVIANGADLARFRPAPPEKTAEPSLLFVGALGGRKRGALLLEWFDAVVRRAFANAVLTMISEEGPPRPGVTYRQGVSAEEIARLYRAAWVYVSPSSYEGFGLPYLEAMASGTPVVASPNVGSRELLGDSEYGLVVDDSEFASTVVRLLSDARLRAEFARLGLQRAQEYSLDTMVAAYERLIWDLIGKPNAPLDDGGANG